MVGVLYCFELNGLVLLRNEPIISEHRHSFYGRVPLAALFNML